MIVSKITPLRDFTHRGLRYESGKAAYIEDETAKRWQRDGYAKRGAVYVVEELIEKAFPPEQETDTVPGTKSKKGDGSD